MLSRDSRIMILGDCWQQFTYGKMDGSTMTLEMKDNEDN
jgi:hypothetical protein